MVKILDDKFPPNRGKRASGKWFFKGRVEEGMQFGRALRIRIQYREVICKKGMEQRGGGKGPQEGGKKRFLKKSSPKKKGFKRWESARRGSVRTSLLKKGCGGGEELKMKGQSVGTGRQNGDV